MLGLLAVLSVIVSATLAVTVPRDSSSHAQRPARQWLRGHGLEVAVPVKRWRLEPQSAAIRYADAQGHTTAQVRAPAVLDAGFCPSSPSSSRAFGGLSTPQRGTIPSVVTGALGTWVAAIGGAAVPVPAVTGPRADVDVPVAAAPCAPITAHLTLVGRATADGVVVLVLVRDVGEPGDLSAADAEEIVGSLRPSGGR